MVGIPRSGDASGVRVNYEARCEDASVAILMSSMSRVPSTSRVSKLTLRSRNKLYLTFGIRSRLAIEGGGIIFMYWLFDVFL